MKTALILLGAGAAVEYKVPSTADLTDRIEAKITADPYIRQAGGDAAFRAIKTGLAGYLQNRA